MIRKLLAMMALAGLVGSPALAADLAVMPVKAPPLPPACTWCGWYVGLNAGGLSPNDPAIQTTGTPGSAASTFGAEANLAALLATNSAGTGKGDFIGGAQLGYNYEFRPFVLGIEADIQGVGGSNSGGSVAGSGSPVGFPNETMTSLTTVSKGLDYFGTLRARLGYEATPVLLLYGTGGLAYGGVKSSTSIAQSDTDILPGAVTATYAGSGTFSDTRAGWTAGAGLEWMFAKQWSAKFEYLYYDLGSVSYAVGPLVANAPGFPSPTWTATGQSTTKFDGNILRVGVNYHF
jgi:outer membrane immunogenic protein